MVFVKELIELGFVKEDAEVRVEEYSGGASVKTFLELNLDLFEDDNDEMELYNIDSAIFVTRTYPFFNQRFDKLLANEKEAEIMGEYFAIGEDYFIGSKVRNIEDIKSVIEDWKKSAFSAIEVLRGRAKKLHDRIKK